MLGLVMLLEETETNGRYGKAIRNYAAERALTSLQDGGCGEAGVRLFSVIILPTVV